MENLRAARPDEAAIRGEGGRRPSCRNRRRADEASGPDRGHAAIRRPGPRRLEADPRTSSAPCYVVGDCRTWRRRVAEEYAAELTGRRVGGQDLQDRAPLTLPHGWEEALGRGRGGGRKKKRKSSYETRD